MFDNANGLLCQERLLRSRHIATMVTWHYTSPLYIYYKYYFTGRLIYLNYLNLSASTSSTPARYILSSGLVGLLIRTCELWRGWIPNFFSSCNHASASPVKYSWFPVKMTFSSVWQWVITALLLPNEWNTVRPLYNGHLRNRRKWLLWRRGGGHYREVGVLYNNFSYGVQQFMLTVSHNDNPIIDFVYRLTEYAKKLE